MRWALWRAASSSEPTSVGRMIERSSESGFSSLTTRRSSWSAGRRRRSSRPGSAKLQPTISDSPRPHSRSSAPRRTRWAWLRRPAAPRRAGRVAGRRSTPSMRATSSIRSISRVTSLRRTAGTPTSRPSWARGDLEVERPQDLGLALGSDLHAEDRPHALAAQVDRIGRRRHPADVDRAGGDARAAQLDHQLRGHRLGLHALLGREPLLEARGGLAAQAQGPRAAVDVGAVPGRDLHQHPGRVVLHLRTGSSHQAGDRGRPPGVLDHDHLAVEGAGLAVEGLHLLALGGAADRQP